MMNPTIRLLYAEDNPQDADLTRAHFAEQAPDFDLQVVATGAECLEQILRNPPDLLLLDHHLPDTDGVEMLKTLFLQAPGLPVVMVTGAGHEELVLRALRLGAATYVPKRGSYLESLPGLLREVLAERGRKQGQALPGAAAARRILYVEHLPMDIDLTLQHFAEHAPHLAVEAVHTCAEALVRLAQAPAYDLVLVDLRMPDQSGLDFVREAKLRLARLPPFIMISGTGDEETAVATLKLGAADYVVKREGYLSQLPFRIELAIASDGLARNNDELRVELVHRKQAEDRGLVQERRLDLAAEFGGMGLWDLDMTTNLAWRTLQHDRLFGYDELQPSWGVEDALRHVVPEDRPIFQHALDEALTTGIFHYELRIEPKSGPRRWIEANGRVSRDDAGRPLRMAGSLVDITDRKLAEEALGALQGQFALNSRLAALGTLVAGVAHEINNPLAAALSDQDLARRTVREFRDRLGGSGLLDLKSELLKLDEVVEELDEAQEAGRRIERIVKDLKVFGRPNQKDARERVRLIDLVDLAMRWLPAAINPTATVTAENGGAPDVVATAGQITQVVVNLVTNAAKATPEGMRGAIVIRTGPGDAGMARLEVIDHGKGIDPSVLPHIFEPFFTTRGVGKGTGLGLSICHSIVTNHGGTLTVESEVGKGSTFRVELPAAPAEGADW
jgi:two-component system NtrC family sensor kinase